MIANVVVKAMAHKPLVYAPCEVRMMPRAAAPIPPPN